MPPEKSSTPIKSPLRQVRRIVTGENLQGRSVFISDGPTPNVTAPAHSPLVAQVVWATGTGAASGEDPAPEGHVFGFHSNGGSILRIVDFPPDDEYDIAQMTVMLDENHV